MARYRTDPQCPFCSEQIADAVYEEVREWQEPFFGDTFSHWKYRDHKCKEGNEFKKEINKLKKPKKQYYGIIKEEKVFKCT